MVDGRVSTTQEMLASLPQGSELLSGWSLLVSSLKAASSSYPVKYTYELFGFFFDLLLSSTVAIIIIFLNFLYTGRRKGNTGK